MRGLRRVSLVTFAVTVLWQGTARAGCLRGIDMGRVTYRFAVPTLQIAATLPTGTVMATAWVPLRERASTAKACDAPVSETLWHAGHVGRVVQVATDLAGVDIRLVLEPNASAAGAPSGQGWNVWPVPSTLPLGGVRVELVKSGPIRSGQISRIPDVQYRVTQGVGKQAKQVRRDTLHYGGQVSVEVVGNLLPSGRLS